MLGAGGFYCWSVYTDSVQPVLATWILLATTTSLSFWTYWSTKRRDIISNVGNLKDVIVSWLILVCTFALDKNIRLGFNMFEIGCLATAVVILIAWRYTKHDVASNLALQVLMVVSYFPLYYHLGTAKENTESFILWGAAWTAGAVGFIPAYLSRDRLAILYSCRGIAMMTMVLALMARLELK